MTINSVKIPSAEPAFREKAWVARVTGTDKKFGYAQTFLPNNIVTEPGLYCASGENTGMRKQNKVKNFYLVGRDIDGNLVRSWALDESDVSEIMSFLLRIKDLVMATPEGKETRSEGRHDGQWKFRADFESPKKEEAKIDEDEQDIKELSEKEKLLIKRDKLFSELTEVNIALAKLG